MIVQLLMVETCLGRGGLFKSEMSLKLHQMGRSRGYRGPLFAVSYYIAETR